MQSARILHAALDDICRQQSYCMQDSKPLCMRQGHRMQAAKTCAGSKANVLQLPRTCTSNKARLLASSKKHVQAARLSHSGGKFTACTKAAACSQARLYEPIKAYWDAGPSNIHLKEREGHLHKLFFTQQRKVPKGGVSHTDLVQEASLSPLLLLNSEIKQALSI